MKLGRNNVKGLKIKMLFVIIGIIVILLLVLFVFKWDNNKKTTTSSIGDSNKNGDYYNNNYIYKIRYDFGMESYIYLLPDNVIKTLGISEIYDVTPDCNCLKATGKYSYDENTINFSEETKKIVINVFDELYKKSGKNYFDAKDMELTKYQQRILSATMLNSEDKITIEKDFDYKIVNEEFSSQNNDYKITNSKTVLNNETKNELVNKISDYLNEIVNNDFDKINNDSKKLANKSGIRENLGVDLKLELVYVGPYSLSFVYTKEGKLGTSSIYDVKGYTFNYVGNVQDFPNGWKDGYYEKALTEFTKTDLYKEYSNQLNDDWQSKLYDNMYITGNWYLGDDKLVFLIPAHLLGLDETTAKIINIEVKVDEEF